MLYRPLLILAAFFIAHFSDAENAQEITIVGSPWCPYSCEDSDKVEGLAVDIIRAIYEPLAIRVTYVQHSDWGAALKLTHSGHYNAVIAAYKINDRGLLYPSTPLFRSNNCFFTKSSNSWVYKGVNSLSHQKLGVIKNYNYGVNLDKYIEKNKHTHIVMTTGESSLDKLFLALREDEVSVILEDRYVFNYNNNKTHPDLSTRVAGCQPPANLYIAFSPNRANSAILAEHFDQGILKLIRSKKLREILSKYSLSP